MISTPAETDILVFRRFNHEPQHMGLATEHRVRRQRGCYRFLDHIIQVSRLDIAVFTPDYATQLLNERRVCYPLASPLDLPANAWQPMLGAMETSEGRGRSKWVHACRHNGELAKALP
jgi:hypothetical protein